MVYKTLFMQFSTKSTTIAIYCILSAMLSIQISVTENKITIPIGQLLILCHFNKLVKRNFHSLIVFQGKKNQN